MLSVSSVVNFLVFTFLFTRPDRPISTGYGMSRSAQWHLDQCQRGQLPPEVAWTKDSDAQASEIVLRQSPETYDVPSVHVYGEDTARMPLFAKVANENRRAIFVGEFGTSPEEESAFVLMLEVVKKAPLSAVWVYDWKNEEFNMAPGTRCSWMFDLLNPVP